MILILVFPRMCGCRILVVVVVAVVVVVFVVVVVCVLFPPRCLLLLEPCVAVHRVLKVHLE